MSLRTTLPSPIRALLRRVYVRFGTMTASGRVEPDFLLVGGQRCGTTSLFRAFEQHPHIIRPRLNKGINYFDLNYQRGERWYRGHYPPERKARPNSDISTAVFEASGYYMFHPLAPMRILNDLPTVKIVAMLRDPVERAFSAWKHERARGFDTLPFDQALETEEARTAGERERMLADPNYQSFAFRHFSYMARGDYVPQLQAFYERLPRNRIHVIYSEDFFRHPEAEFARLADFLGVERLAGIRFERHNARPSGPMPGRSREILAARYAGQAEELEKLVGRLPPWADRRNRTDATQL